MPKTPPNAASRRSVLRGVVLAGSAVIVTPAVVPLAVATPAQALPARAGRAAVRFRCKPGKIRLRVRKRHGGHKLTCVKPKYARARSLVRPTAPRSTAVSTSPASSPTQVVIGPTAPTSSVAATESTAPQQVVSSPTGPTEPTGGSPSQPASGSTDPHHVVSNPTGPTKPTGGNPAQPGSGSGSDPDPLPVGSLLSAADRHLVSRFSYGVDRAQADLVLAAGGAAAWFDDQLSYAGTFDPATTALTDWWPSLSRTPQSLWSRHVSEVEFGWQVMQDYQRLLLMRRITTSRPVLDVMAEFWENHFNVSVLGDNVFPYRVSYGADLRARALGTFKSLLATAVLHPAMLIYLNGAVSTKDQPNENLGRELLELHTVGRGHYDEDDVKSSARILTGFSVDVRGTWDASYRSEDHFRGPVSVMGFRDGNAAADGRDVARRYLDYLATHPATARRIALKLATKFVSDNPSKALVDRLAEVYLANDTAVAPVLRALVGSGEFAASQGAKVRDPAEEVVATYRVLGIDVSPPGGGRPTNSAEQVLLFQCGNIGQTPHSWPQPNGAPANNEVWSSPSRLLASLSMHFSMAGASYPSTGVRFRPPASWMPSRAVTFADLVEHLSREVLHTSTPPGLLAATRLALDIAANEVITFDHPVIRYRFGRLLATVLDHPMHLKR